MPQTGYPPIKHYRSTTASAVPAAGDLAAGELAINTTDEKLYFKNTAGVVKLLAANVTAPANGGTGITSYAVGDLVYASGATTLSKLADVATGNVLLSGGVGVAPAYGKVGLTTHITGTLAAANGGTGITSYAVGDLVYASDATTLSKLADVATGNVLLSGGVGVAPSYGKVGLTTHVTGTLPVANGGTGAATLTGYVKGAGTAAFTASATIPAADISSGAALTSVNDTNVTLTLGGTPASALLTATSLTLGWSGQLAVSRGGTGTSTAFTAGSLVFAGAGGTYSQDNANLFWDNTNKRLGLGTALPDGGLHIAGASPSWYFEETDQAVDEKKWRWNSASKVLALQSVNDAVSSAVAALQIVRGTGTAIDAVVFSTASGTERVRIDSTGNVGIGRTADAAYKLDVEGSIRAGTLWLKSNGAEGGELALFNKENTTVKYSFDVNSTGTGRIFTVENNTNLQIGQLAGTGGTIAFHTGAAERFKINADGSIISSDRDDAVGYKGIPQNAKTAAYTLALGDMGKHISITTGGITIPANASVAFPVGATVVIFNNSTSTQNIAITTDTLRLAGTTTTGTRTLTAYGLATLLKVASTTWVVSGAGVS